MGDSALTSNTTGSSNVALGFDALLDNVTHDGNTAIGTSALQNNDASFNTARRGIGAL